MKKIYLLLVVAVLSFTSCHTDIWNSINDLDSRVKALEELCREMNTNISSLQALIEVIQSGDYITNIVPITKGGEVIGYTIMFKNHEPITIYNGEDGVTANTPIIGAAQDTDGVYYWTVNGEWLLDDNGNKIRVTGNDGQPGSVGQTGPSGITPTLKIENGMWYVSYDNGSTWTMLGQATGTPGQPGQNGQNGDSMFTSVTYDDENMYFTLFDGTTITIPYGNTNTPRTIRFDVNGETFTMIKVDEGVFMMGALAGDTAARSNEFPAHRVRLSEYYICKTEVTQALWLNVMGSNPSSHQGLDLPVDSISWLDCQNFIVSLNTLLSSQLNGMSFRLPTEAEWEFACRGGDRSLGYLYGGSDDLYSCAWFVGNSLGQTHSVGTLSPNELGLYDMSGNVYEMCSDWYAANYYASSPIDNPKGPTTGTMHVHRGGCFHNTYWRCRSTHRTEGGVNYKSSTLGFRLVLSE